jgi:hypothetical protein
MFSKLIGNDEEGFNMLEYAIEFLPKNTLDEYKRKLQLQL